jgi:hypothetical protein
MTTNLPCAWCGGAGFEPVPLGDNGQAVLYELLPCAVCGGDGKATEADRGREPSAARQAAWQALCREAFEEGGGDHAAQNG